MNTSELRKLHERPNPVEKLSKCAAKPGQNCGKSGQNCSKSSDISTQHCGPKQDILIKLYQKELRQLLGYGIYMIMLMILTFNKDPQV